MVQTLCSTQCHFCLKASSACLVSSDTTADFASLCLVILSLPSCTPLLHGRYPLHRYYECSVLLPDGFASILSGRGYPFFTHLSFQPFCLQPLGCLHRWFCSFPFLSAVGNEFVPYLSIPPFQSMGLTRGFATHSQARPSSSAESSSRLSHYGLAVHFQQLPTPCFHDAVAFSFRLGTSLTGTFTQLDRCALKAHECRCPHRPAR